MRLEKESGAESDDGDDDDSVSGSGKGAEAPISRRANRGKMSRAERNRQNRHKHSLSLQRQAAKRKKSLAQVSRVGELLKGLKSDEADQQVQHAHKRARKEQPEEAPRFEEKLGGLTRKVGAMVHAPSVAVPLSEELTGNLRTLRTKSSVLKDQIDAKQFAIDPQLKLRTTMG